MSTAAPLITASDLGRRFKERWAVRHLTLSVAGGEILGLLGPNGAGKSTTVRMLTGQLGPSEGTASVCGVDVAAQRQRLGSVLGVTFEQQNLYERLSARENLEFFARLSGIDDNRVQELLGQAELLERADEPLWQLSRGLRQRVMLSRALLSRPRALFLDEPTAGLDPHAARGVRKWIADLAEAGAAVLLTTHDMEEAAAICHRVAILHQGRLLTAEPPAELITRVCPPRLRVWVQKPDDDTATEILLPAEPSEAARQLSALQQSARVLRIQEEASNLEAVFLQLTGQPLQ